MAAAKVAAAGAAVLVTATVALALLASGASLTAAAQTSVGVPAALRSGTVPAWAVRWLQKAAGTCPEVTAPLLAAQIEAESGWNPHASSPVGAAGLSQFMPATWATVGIDGDGDGRKDPQTPADAIATQARYDCDTLAQIKKARIPGDAIDLMLASYNAGFGAVAQFHGVPPFPETQSYVKRIKSLVAKYSSGGTSVAAPGAATGTVAVVKAAQSQLGVMYAWGGGTLDGPSAGITPDAGVAGFDCSSFTRYAYYQGTRGKTTLPRTAAAQYQATKSKPVPRTALQPGDLLFWGTSPASVHHVAIYTGQGHMVEAQQSGVPIKNSPVRMGGDFLAATRVL